jgi:hypothetical protein
MEFEMKLIMQILRMEIMRNTGSHVYTPLLTLARANIESRTMSVIRRLVKF